MYYIVSYYEGRSRPKGGRSQHVQEVRHLNNDNYSENTTYGQPGSGAASAAGSASQNQFVTIFVLGLCSLLALFLLPVVGLVVSLVCGIVALVFAGKARQNGGLAGLGQAGFILAIIGTALSGLLAVFVLIALIAGLTAFGAAVGPLAGLLNDAAWFMFR